MEVTTKFSCPTIEQNVGCVNIRSFFAKMSFLSFLGEKLFQVKKSWQKNGTPHFFTKCLFRANITKLKE